MLQPLDKNIGPVAHIPGMPPHQIIFQNRNYLVVDLAIIDHLQSANDSRADDDFIPRYRPFA